MATATMRRAEVAPVSPERQALRDARSALSEIKTEIAELEAAANMSLTAFTDACRAVEDLEVQIDRECPRPWLPARMVGRPDVLGEAPPPPPELAEKLAAAKAVLARISRERAADRERLPELEKLHDWRKAALRKCAAAELRTSPAVRRLVERAERCQRDATDACLALNWCVQEGVIGRDDMAAAIVLARWDAASFSWHDLTYQVQGGRPFVEALEALLADPDAPLPD
jgi:hypothetical protein